ncbi:hypothetical protein QFZ82_001571 [Streptomyces sp. V4I23]|uniref:hypothetical protein n=1 Tax=Streptomyces sp. V4I23 TaxID=3042282 RepID=UPI002784CEC1|nr:hypothetical protein [Streptomyces sp. V4I23]MDQ1007086.1 hypothetical protein [Streptomyces sp. V4I23]
MPGYEVRSATDGHLAACNEVRRKVHGFDRGGELKAGTGRVTEHDERVTGYTTDLSFFAHADGETTEDIRALIASARSFGGPGILVPASNSALFQWCLGNGLRSEPADEPDDRRPLQRARRGGPAFHFLVSPRAEVPWAPGCRVPAG